MKKAVGESFRPRWYSVFFNPFYIIRRDLYKSLQQNAGFLHGDILDFGCGSKPYAGLFNVASYTGLDYQTEVSDKNSNLQADVFYDGVTVPFPDNHFDGVFSSEVLEHVFNPDVILPELHRVLKPGGHFMFTCPFFWPEHEQPYDYARYTSFALHHLMEKHGFEVVRFEKTGSYFESVHQAIILYLYFFIPHRPRFLLVLFFTLFITPWVLAGIFWPRILPKRVLRKDLYLNNLMLAKKKPGAVSLP